ncbi:platelet endothelial cell adhesion molecule-like [Engraulis encrasicolus]|uniref:platelet endothelial cell adhesion molecule-like n=1 Tax=Engraulis encrasicolus TaxID=184585 RepID=UPI002FD27E02
MECDGHVLLLLSVMLLTGQGSAQGSELSFTIDHVSLSVLPGPDVHTGTNVTLRCHVQVSHSAQWLMHSFSFLLEAVEVHAHNSTDSQSDYSLLPARAAHSGAYSCRVRVLEKERSSPDTHLNVSGSTHTHTSRVRVLEKERSSPDTHLNVSGLTTPLLTVDSAVIYEGQEVKVSCLAPDEKGPLKFQLEVNGERKRDFTNAQNPVSLQMNTPGRMTLRCRMRLLLRPEAGETISNLVTITVKELMVTPTVTFEPASGVVEGDFLMVRCSVPTFSELPRNERARLEIFLTKDGRVLRQLTGRAEVPHQLRAVASDAGTYVCKTEMQGGNLQKTASATTTVTELFSAPEVSVRPPVVFEGDNFTVSCSVRRLVENREAVLRYRLFHQGALLHHGQHYTVTAAVNAHTDTNGQYVCQAEAKEILRNSTALSVTARILASQPAISAKGGVIIGRPFQVVCRSDRGSLPVTFTLMKGQRSLGSQEVNALSAVFNVSANAVRDGAELAQLNCRAANHPDRTPLQSPPLQASVIGE